MKSPARFLAFALLLVASAVPAQTPPVQGDEPSGASPSPGSKDEKKKSFVRLWNYSYFANSPSVAVFLGPPGDKVPAFEKRTFLARGSKSPETRNYWEVPKGDYEIYVVADDAVPGNMGAKIGPAAPPQPSLLIKRQGLRVDGGSHQTIILEPKDGRIAVRVLEDSKITDGPSHLRIFTFNTTVTPTVSVLASDGKSKSLAEKVGNDGADILLTNQPNPLTLEISYPLRPDFISRQNVEMDYQKFKSCTVIFAPDRYGALSAQFSNDVPKSTSVESNDP